MSGALPDFASLAVNRPAKGPAFTKGHSNVDGWGGDGRRRQAWEGDTKQGDSW